MVEIGWRSEGERGGGETSVVTYFIERTIASTHVPGEHFGRLVCVAFTVIYILEHWAALILLHRCRNWYNRSGWNGSARKCSARCLCVGQLSIHDNCSSEIALFTIYLKSGDFLSSYNCLFSVCSDCLLFPVSSDSGIHNIRALCFGFSFIFHYSCSFRPFPPVT